MSGLAIATDKAGAIGRSHLSGPDPVVAGEAGTWTIRVEAGAAGAWPAGSALAFVRRWPSDWDTPDAVNTRIRFDRPCRHRWRNYRSLDWHPFDHAFEVELHDETSAATVEFDLRAQTFIEEASPVSVRLRLGHGEWCEIAVHTVRVIGGAAHRFDLVAPSDIAAGEAFELALRVEDKWGNPAALAGTVAIDGADATALPDLPGVRRWRATVAAPSVAVRLVAHIGSDIVRSNPIRVHEFAPEQHVRWGDIHAQCLIGCGARTIDAFFAHARDFARLDFASHQANCFLVSTPEWHETQAVTAAFDDPGRFVALLGLEWSADTAKGGDRNLYFPGDVAKLTRCSHEYVDDKSDLADDLATAEDLHAHYSGSKTIIALHVGGRTTDLKRHDPALERLIEVHSTHATSEWFLFEALRRGYRMGVTAGSDGVDGRPGASHPGHQTVRNVRGGLVAAAVRTTTREGVWEALAARRCYATNGPRMRVDFSADGRPMGSEFRAARAPVLKIAIEGTHALEAVDVFRGTTILHSPLLRSAQAALSDRIRIAWKGATAPGNFMRARMRWDGHAALDCGRFADIEGYAFDTPDEGIVGTADGRIDWRSMTGGDWDGIVARLVDAEAAILTVSTPQISASVPIAALAQGPILFVDEKPARALEIRRVPVDLGSSDWRGEFCDPNPEPGWNAYWVRARQWDGGFAWSSPIFVEIAGP